MSLIGDVTDEPSPKLSIWMRASVVDAVCSCREMGGTPVVIAVGVANNGLGADVGVLGSVAISAGVVTAGVGSAGAVCASVDTAGVSSAGAANAVVTTGSGATGGIPPGPFNAGVIVAIRSPTVLSRGMDTVGSKSPPGSMAGSFPAAGLVQAESRQKTRIKGRYLGKYEVNLAASSIFVIPLSLQTINLTKFGLQVADIRRWIDL